MHTSPVPVLHAAPKHIDVKTCLSQHGGSGGRTPVGSAHGNNAVTFDGTQLVDAVREFINWYVQRASDVPKRAVEFILAAQMRFDRSGVRAVV
jgi:hypothetical protein